MILDEFQWRRVSYRLLSANDNPRHLQCLTDESDLKQCHWLLPKAALQVSLNNSVSHWANTAHYLSPGSKSMGSLPFYTLGNQTRLGFFIKEPKPSQASVIEQSLGETPGLLSRKLDIRGKQGLLLVKEGCLRDYIKLEDVQLAFDLFESPTSILGSCDFGYLKAVWEDELIDLYAQLLTAQYEYGVLELYDCRVHVEFLLAIIHGIPLWDWFSLIQSRKTLGHSIQEAW